jgi:hypothetical protein
MKTKAVKIERPDDLAPTGVRSTIKGDYTFEEVFAHIFFTGLGIRERKIIKK